MLTSQRTYDPSVAISGILAPSLLQVRLALKSKHECSVSWIADPFNYLGLHVSLAHRPCELENPPRIQDWNALLGI